jgi:drug/metabolite transporter (DMT)-like permease
MTRRPNLGPLLIFLAAMLWATDAPFRTALLEHLSPSAVVLGEHAVNALLFAPVLALGARKLRRLAAKEWAALIVIAVGGSAVATFAFTKSFEYVNPSVAILLQKLQPLIAVALASSLLRERMGRGFWLWALLALVGAYVLSFPNLVPRVYEGEQFNPNIIGSGLALLAAALWAVSTVLGKYALRRVDFTTVTSLRFVVAFAFLVIWNAAAGGLRDLAAVTPRDAGYLILVALVSGGISLWMYYKGLTTTKASVATIAELGFPLAAVLINAVFLDAQLSPAQIGGMSLLLLAVLMLRRENERAAEPAPLHMIPTEARRADPR